MKYPPFLKKYAFELILIIFSLSFSSWLMYSSFSYKDSSMLISTKAWSDFASHIPLIRSFSLGDNFPPQYPIFPGEPIRYHFLFYMLVGFLERIGAQIDTALNLLSSFSFALLLLSIYFLAKTLFKSKMTGVLSILFFLFNGSLSFFEFFKIHPLSISTINDILTNNSFPSFGPYDGKIVSAFWNLNIYTNQRHLALPLSFLLLIVSLILIYEQKKKIIPKKIIIPLGILIGILPFLHSSIFIMAISVLLFLFLLIPEQRKSLFFLLILSAVISLPRILFLKETATYSPHLQLGYLAGNLNLPGILEYWFMNLGLFLILIPLGFLLSSSIQKKIFISFLSLFLIANLIQFSPEIAGNHKFINAFLIVGNMYTAFFLVRYWKKHKYLKTLVFPCVFLLIFSGIIEFFPIKNDKFITLEDYPGNEDIKWIKENTSRKSVFLNSTYLYNPASLAGRKIFLGWPYFAWSLGYDTGTRGRTMKTIFEEKDKQTACKILEENGIDFVETKKIYTYDPDMPSASDLFEKEFHLVYFDLKRNYILYDVKKSCL